MSQCLNNPAITINRWGVVFFNKHVIKTLGLHQGQKLKVVMDGPYGIEILQEHKKPNTIYRRGRGLYLQGSLKLRPGTYTIQGYEGSYITYKEQKRQY